MFRDRIETILREMDSVLKSVDQREVDALISAIISANRIVLCGAGRVGFACRGFAMRLAHLGFKAFTLGDSTVPSVGSGDLLLIGSGSGETQTIYDIAVLGKRDSSHIALVTGRPDSRIGQLADTVVVLKAPSKIQAIGSLVSIQPMTTLNEQCLQIFFDALVLLLMEHTKQNHEHLWARHSNLE